MLLKRFFDGSTRGKVIKHIVMILVVVVFVRQEIEAVYDIYWNEFNF